MNFRLIQPGDLSEIIEIRGSTRENPVSRTALRNLGITEESTAELLRTTHRGWLCEEDGRIVGFAIGDGKTGELWVIAVLPEFEGRGVGWRLLDAVEAWLWSLGWREVWLWTSPDRQKRAFNFYLKRGWFVSELKGGMLFMKKKRPDRSLEPKATAGASAAEQPWETAVGVDLSVTSGKDDDLMLGSAAVIGFIPTTDFRRAKRFFGKTLGLRFVARDKFALVFESGGTKIRIVKVGPFAAAGFTIFGWQVAQIDAWVRKLAERGIVFERYAWMKQDDLGIWTAPGGTKVAWFKDPDGNVLSLSSQ